MDALLVPEPDNRPRRLAATCGAILLALLIALAVYGPHLFDLSAPTEDARAHIFKIEFLQSHLAEGKLPAWSPYWYDGLPYDPLYPPLFYLMGAGLTFVFGQAVIAYKILIFLALALNGITAYYFARRFLNFSRATAFVCLVAYETSAPLLVNFMHGEGPNLLGWSFSLLFLAVFLNQMSAHAPKLSQAVLPGLLLGLTVLLHPFPVVFAVLAVALYYVIFIAYRRFNLKSVLPYLPYTIGVAAIGLVVSAGYWLPALLVFGYASPIYVSIQDYWSGGLPYVLALALLALLVYLFMRRRLEASPRLDFIAACLALSVALGLGATRLLPFGLASMLHEFRFATIMAPLFAVLLLALTLERLPARITASRLTFAVILSLALLLAIFALAKQMLATGISYSHLSGLIRRDLAPFLPLLAPFLALLLLALSDGAAITRAWRWLALSAAALGIVLLTSVIPAVNTWRTASLSTLFRYVDSYQQPEYAEVMSSVEQGRLIVPAIAGNLTEGDSPVTFGWRWGVATVNGPYNQGDPKFFKNTVHLEWEERWLGYPVTRQNLMQENAAAYIFIRDGRELEGDFSDLATVADNGYGRLLALDGAVAHAVSVTPILVDAADVQAITEYLNILMPDGYKVVLVDAASIAAEYHHLFDYVLSDDAARLASYPGQHKILLTEADSVSFTREGQVAQLSLPYLSTTDSLFYHGDPGRVKAWQDFDATLSREAISSGLAGAQAARDALEPLLSALDYTEAGYSYAENSIDINAPPGFTLVKDSYFPYWQASQGAIMPTTQGLMLVYDDGGQVSLNYTLPSLYAVSAVLSISSLALAAGWLLVTALVRRPDRT